jgi:hypothetical protein
MFYDIKCFCSDRSEYNDLVKQEAAVRLVQDDKYAFGHSIARGQTQKLVFQSGIFTQ